MLTHQVSHSLCVALTFGGSRLLRQGPAPAPATRKSAASVTRDLRSWRTSTGRVCLLADDEVALPMAGLGSGVDSLRPFMDGDPIFDRISRGPRSARTPAFVMRAGKTVA
jgi:hypothetical protein